MKSKKGIMLRQAFPAVLTLVLVAILIIVSIVIFSALQTSFPLTSVTVSNETGGYINTTGYTLGESTHCGFASPSITEIWNGTTNLLIKTGNYTLTGNVLYNATTTTWSNVNVSYTYEWGGDGCTASANTITAFATYPALLGLVGTIIFLALVIGVLVASFAFNRKGGM